MECSLYLKLYFEVCNLCIFRIANSIYSVILASLQQLYLYSNIQIVWREVAQLQSTEPISPIIIQSKI